jgi:hypothetical protein
MYKLTNPINNVNRTIIWQKDDVFMCIPVDETNTDYQKYLKWLAEGNEPLPADE